MDWDLDRASRTRSGKVQEMGQDSNRRRLVLDKKCSGCGKRLIKQTYSLTLKQYEELYPGYKNWMDSNEECEDCYGKTRIYSDSIRISEVRQTG